MDTTALPKASLIIASRNRARLLADTVASVLGGHERPAELIIVDQSEARDEGLSTLTAPDCDVRYLWSRTRGLSRANNVGVGAARHDLLVFTHDDVRVAPEWLGRIARAAAAAGAGTIVTGRVLPGESERPGGFVPTLKTDPSPTTYAGRIHDDVLYPLNMAMHRSALEAVGTFDERLGPGTRYPAAEDNDLAFRLLEAGFRIAYDPDAVVYHRAWRDDFVRLRWQYARGQGAFLAKHLDLRDRYMLGRAASELGRHARNLVAHALRGNRRALGYAASIAGLLSGATQWLATEPRAGKRTRSAR